MLALQLFPSCISGCNDGTWGDRCNKTCGECAEGAACSIFTGQCPQGGLCEPGWQAGNCSLGMHGHDIIVPLISFYKKCHGLVRKNKKAIYDY